MTDTPAQLQATTARVPSETFIEAFTRNQRRLYLYILAQYPNPTEAEEILQETNIIIWRKFEQFEEGTNFIAWASQIARYEVLKHLERVKRDRKHFSHQFVEQLAADALEVSPRWEARREALQECLQKLKPKDRKLIQRRYAPGSNGKSVAEALNRPANSVYQSLGRIRRTLLECIDRNMTEAES